MSTDPTHGKIESDSVRGRPRTLVLELRRFHPGGTQGAANFHLSATTRWGFSTKPTLLFCHSIGRFATSKVT